MPRVTEILFANFKSSHVKYVWDSSKLTQKFVQGKSPPWGAPTTIEGLDEVKIDGDTPMTILNMLVKALLGGGFKYFPFSPLLGEDSHFD